jgi:hypothetical protein
MGFYVLDDYTYCLRLYALPAFDHERKGGDGVKMNTQDFSLRIGRSLTVRNVKVCAHLSEKLRVTYGKHFLKWINLENPSIAAKKVKAKRRV